MSEKVGSIFYDLDLDSKKFDKGSERASKKVSRLGESFRKAEGSSKLLLASVIGLGTGLFAAGLKFTLTAARTETLGVAMEAVAKATGTSMDVIKEQEKTLKKQGITTQEARATLTKFMQAQLDVADASKIARVAQDLAVIAGEDSSTTTARLTQAIATQRPILLRQVGITTGLEEIYSEYAKTIGKTADGLTDIEQKQAFVNKILKEGEKVTGTYEAALGTAGKKMGSMKRLIEEAMNSIGERFLPILGKVIDKLSLFLKKITPENIDLFIKKLGENKDILFIVASAITVALLPALVALAASIWATLAPLLPFIAVGAAIGFVVTKIVKAFGGWEKIIDKIRPAIDFLRGTLELLVTKIGSLGGKFKEFINSSAVQKFIQILRDTIIKIFQNLKKAFDTLRPKIGELIIKFQEFWVKIQPVIKVLMIIVGVIIGVLIVAIFKLVQVLSAVLGPVLGFIIDIFGILLTVIGNVVQFFIEKVAPVFIEISTKIASIIIWLVKKVILPHVQKIVKGFKVVASIFSWLYKNIIKPIVGFISTIVSVHLKNIFDSVSFYMGKVIEGVKWAWGLIKKYIIEPYKEAFALVKDYISKLFSSVEKTWNDIVDFLQGLAEKIVNAIKEPFEKAKSTVESIAQGISDATDKINPFSKESPSLVEWVQRGTEEIANLYDKMFSSLDNISKKGRLNLTGTTQVLHENIQGVSTQPVTQPPINLTLAPKGIIARSRGEMREIAVDLLEMANEELRARGLNEIQLSKIKGATP